MSARPAAVAGRFYPATPGALSQLVDECLSEPQVNGSPKALIVPHAGYVYSGSLAGRAYGLALDGVNRVVVLGPNHTAPLRGVALTSHDHWVTPLGEVEIDTAEVQRLALRPDAMIDDALHLSEHCVEVQIPFLQRVLPTGFKLVPMVVGEMSPEAVASLIRDCWGDSHTLIVVSTDLSHYLSYEHAQLRDRATADAILHATHDAIGDASACGRSPLRGLLTVAAEDGLEVIELGVWNSGDTMGDRARVVGYGAFALFEPAS